MKQWLENLSRGQAVARQAQGLTMPISAAASDKHRNWLLIDGGGSIAALTLDLSLRSASHERFGLSDVLRALFAELGVPGKTYRFDDLVRVTKTVRGQDVGPLLDRIVNRAEPADLRPVFALLGQRLEQYLLLEHTLVQDPRASPASTQRWKAVFGPGR